MPGGRPDQEFAAHTSRGQVAIFLLPTGAKFVPREGVQFCKLLLQVAIRSHGDQATAAVSLMRYRRKPSLLVSLVRVETEFLLHRSGEKAAHGMGLPTGCLDELMERRALG
jgi:hypothetical protein